MEVITLQQNYKRPIILCLGFFDSMHMGHVKLLNCAKKMAFNCEIPAQVALFTFNNNHFETLNRPTKLLYSFDERLTVYESFGIDVVISANFNSYFQSLTGETFLKMLSKYDLCGVVCGADFTCGSDMMTAQGVKYCLANICPVEIVDIVRMGDQKICSSYIRELLLQNKIDIANNFLSQPFFYMGEVVRGRNVGSGMGFPTININVPNEKIMPLGVYGGRVSWGNKNSAKAIINVGPKPTFFCDEQSVEAHLVDFDGNLYGKKVKISLLRYLRPIQKFDSVKDLQMQLQRDLLAVEND